MIYKILTIKFRKWAGNLVEKKGILLSKSDKQFSKESPMPRIYSGPYQILSTHSSEPLRKKNLRIKTISECIIIVFVTEQIPWGYLEMTRWRIHRKKTNHSTCFLHGQNGYISWWYIHLIQEKIAQNASGVLPYSYTYILRK